MSLDALRADVLSAWSLRNIGSDTPPGFVSASPDEIFEDVFPSSIQRFGGVFCLSFDGLARFRIDPVAKEITIFDIKPETGPDDLEHLLYDHVVPRIFAEEGAVVLHASAVEIGGRLAVFLGNTGAGKSTLAASLHTAGHLLLGDDAVIVSVREGRFYGSAVYPTLRLFPDTIAEVLGGSVETSPMAHYSEKLRVSLASHAHRAAGSFPLGALFFIGGGSDTPEPRAEELGPSAACMALVEQSFALDPKDPDKAAARLGKLSRLAAAVPAHRLIYPHDYARIAALHEVIFACMARSGNDAPEGKRALAD
ncbi:MAG: hypothetical protein V2I39_06670 [Erythrobacter sp.]|jgi:hypothetical protein|nr:hypothetical protein [Erythrobacter sp.]